MREISQRELRNDSAAVLRAVEAGESLIVTRRGVPVARIGPIQAPEMASRPPRRRPDFVDRERIRLGQPTSELLGDLRGER